MERIDDVTVIMAEVMMWWKRRKELVTDSESDSLVKREHPGRSLE